MDGYKRKKESSWVKLKAFPTKVGRPKRRTKSGELDNVHDKEKMTKNRTSRNTTPAGMSEEETTLCPEKRPQYFFCNILHKTLAML